jgi:hypothetical protein
MHILVNPFVSSLLKGDHRPEAIAQAYAIYRECAFIAASVDLQHQGAQGVSLTALNRFQRSLLSKQVNAVKKDSTVGLSTFISSVLISIHDYLDAVSWSDLKTQVCLALVDGCQATKRCIAFPSAGHLFDPLSEANHVTHNQP